MPYTSITEDPPGFHGCVSKLGVPNPLSISCPLPPIDRGLQRQLSKNFASVKLKKGMLGDFWRELPPNTLNLFIQLVSATTSFSHKQNFSGIFGGIKTRKVRPLLKPF